MIRGITALLGFWFVGEALVLVTGLAVPGSVLGMLLLFGWLQWRRPAGDAAVFRAGDGLLRHLQLLFVPAGVGVIAYAGQLQAHALPLLAGFVVSWAVVIVALGWFVQLLAEQPPAASEADAGV